VRDTVEEIVYRPIGIIRSPLRGEDHIPPQPSHIRNVEGTVELLPEYAGGLKDLEGFSHIILLCHLHLSKGFSLIVKPPSDTTIHGVFATRSPRRPNPIAMSTVRLIRIDGPTLHIRDIDMVDRTPVLDIKPYIPLAQSGESIRTGWLTRRSNAT